MNRRVTLRLTTWLSLYLQVGVAVLFSGARGQSVCELKFWSFFVCRVSVCCWRGEDLRRLGPGVDHVLILLTISGWDILYRIV
ncbi:hypothetical protein LINPERHAP1_LOCUS19023, partial [Linum perenne]